MSHALPPPFAVAAAAIVVALAVASTVVAAVDAVASGVCRPEHLLLKVLLWL